MMFQQNLIYDGFDLINLCCEVFLFPDNFMERKVFGELHLLLSVQIPDRANPVKLP